MELAKAVAFQLPQTTLDSELVFQFYRVGAEVHANALTTTPLLLQQQAEAEAAVEAAVSAVAGPGTVSAAAVPCYQVLNVVTYAVFDLAHLALEEYAEKVDTGKVQAELLGLLPVLVRANKISQENGLSFGALGAVLVKSSLGYALLRLGRVEEALRVLEPVPVVLARSPGLVRQILCWHFAHCVMFVYGVYRKKEYEQLRQVYNAAVAATAGTPQFRDAHPFPPINQLQRHGALLCANPLCRVMQACLPTDAGHADGAATVDGAASAGTAAGTGAAADAGAAVPRAGGWNGKAGHGAGAYVGHRGALGVPVADVPGSGGSSSTGGGGGSGGGTSSQGAHGGRRYRGVSQRFGGGPSYSGFGGRSRHGDGAPAVSAAAATAGGGAAAGAAASLQEPALDGHSGLYGTYSGQGGGSGGRGGVGGVGGTLKMQNDGHLLDGAGEGHKTGWSPNPNHMGTSAAAGGRFPSSTPTLPPPPAAFLPDAANGQPGAGGKGPPYPNAVG
ncbi:unnamed protein product [Phaeothamnion confervicola]